MLCGSCFQELGSKLTPQDAVPQQQQGQEQEQAQPPVEESRTVQVRCGQCSAVNAVQVLIDATVIQFECGSCDTINEVSL
ncbi:hypothetical protein STCU_01848 [Strigomonas culicis]|nr:hypothetical protein STCU_01848 [Strigomonas culicis]|eukprot:EPY33918.1 hypothetical protein STCU_01848 [Strigomonas culicis]